MKKCTVYFKDKDTADSGRLELTGNIKFHQDRNFCVFRQYDDDCNGRRVLTESVHINISEIKLITEEYNYETRT